MKLEIKEPQSWPISEKAITAIEWMLERATVRSTGYDGGLTWTIELDGHAFQLDVDRDGKVRASTHE